MAPLPAFRGTGSTLGKSWSSGPSDAERFADGSGRSDMEVSEGEVLAGGGRASSRRLVHGK